MTAKALAPEIDENVRALLRAHGVTRAALFGSWARGDATAQSDIDFLVEFEPSRSLLDLAALELDLVEALEHPVDVVTYRSLHPALRESVMSDQVGIL